MGDDLLEKLKEFLPQHMTNHPHVEIIPAADLYPTEVGFPLVGIMDGNDSVDAGASEELYKEIVFITFYDQSLGDYPSTILNVRKMKEEVRTLFNQSDTWKLFECDNISYKGSNKLLTFEQEKEGNKEYISFKTAMFEFSMVEEAYQ